MSDNVVEQLWIKLGVDSKGVETGIQNAVKKASFSLKSALTSFVAPIMGALMSGAFIKQTYEEIINLDHLSTSLGVSAEKLQMWQGAAKDAGSSAEAVGAMWQRMNAMITESATTGKGTLQDYADQGILPALKTVDGKIKDTETYLLELSDAFKKMDAQQASGIGRKIGIRDFNLMNFLQQGSGEVNAQLRHIKELGIYTKEDVEIAREFDVALNDVTRVLKMSLVPIFRIVTPLISKMGMALVELRKHWMVLVPALALVAGMVLKSMIPAFVELYKTIKPLLTLKMAGLLAVLVLLGLALEDIYVWVNGGQSVIGRYLGTWEEFKPTIQPVIDAFIEVGKAIKKLEPTFRELFNAVKPILFKLLETALIVTSLLMRAFLAIIEPLMRYWLLPMLEIINGVIGGVTKLIEAFGEIAGRVGEALTRAKDTVYNTFVAPVMKWFDDLMQKVRNFFSFDFSGRVASLTSRGGGGSFDNSNHVYDVKQTYNIQATEPTLTAREVARTSLATPSDGAY